MVKAVIFDMDGVLIDTVELGLAVRKQLLARYDVDLDTVPDPQGEGHRAASLKHLLASVESSYGIDIDPDEFAKLSIEHMRSSLHKHVKSADPGLVTFLDELKEHNIPCAIASSSLRAGIETKLEVLGIKDYFTVIVTGSDVTKHKPNPEVYLRVIADLHIPPEACVIFEDSLTGVQAGRAAGCKVVGFTQYNPPKTPLPDVCLTVKNWSEISYKQLQHIG